MTTATFIENETGLEVEVTTLFVWEPYPQQCAVRFPSGRTYALPASDILRHFSIKTPQEVFIRQAFGAVDDRPTADQRVVHALAEVAKTGPANTQSESEMTL
jgi:hypothetical protein